MERRTIRGIHFIKVGGTQAERVRAHAALLKEELLEGALPALGKKNEWIIRRGPGIIQLSPIQNLIVKFYRRLFLPALGTRVTAEEKEALHAASQETGLSYDLLRETIYQADAMLLLARTSLMRHVLSEWSPGGMPGCTSGVVLNQWTQSGRLLACRNFDYPLVGPWEKHPTVVFNEPSNTNEIPYVFLSTAGVHVGGITSMNREGLTLFAHAHFGKRVSFKGKSIVLLGDEIIRTSRTINDAIDCAKKYGTHANWAFVVSSAKENEAVVIEMAAGKVRVRSTEEGWITHSNFFHSKDLQKDEAILCGSYCEDLRGRIEQLQKSLKSVKGKVEPAHMAAALGDQTDYYSGIERVFGNTLGVVTTVKSAVFDPGMQKFWMAQREESPMGLGDFIEVDWDRFWKTDPKDYEQSMEVLPGYKPKEPRLVKALQHYRKAYQCFHTYNDQPDYKEKALAHIHDAIQAYPEDGHLWIQAGIVAFKQLMFSEALKYFEGSIPCILTPHVAAVRDLYLARCLDLLKRRKEALVLYSKHQDVQEPSLRKAFRKGKKSAYQKRSVSRILIDLQFPDTFQY